jgi:hypothetical protein
MEQEVGHLCACFGGPDEDEARVRAKREAKTWLTKAHENVERAREHIGSHLRKASGLKLTHFCRHDEPTEKADPATRKFSLLFSGPVVHGKRIRSVCGVSVAKS